MSFLRGFCFPQPFVVWTVYLLLSITVSIQYWTSLRFLKSGPQKYNWYHPPLGLCGAYSGLRSPACAFRAQVISLLRLSSSQPSWTTTHSQALHPLLHDASPSAGAVLFAVSALRGTTLEREWTHISSFLWNTYLTDSNKGASKRILNTKNSNYKHLVIICTRECAKTNFQRLA